MFASVSVYVRVDMYAPLRFFLHLFPDPFLSLSFASSSLVICADLSSLCV